MKITEFIKTSTLFIGLLVAVPLFAANPYQEVILSLQELRASFYDYARDLHEQKVELDILHEKSTKLEKEVSECKEEAKKGGASSQKLASSQMGSLETRLSSLEHQQEGFVKDLKLLKTCLEQSNTQLATCLDGLSRLEKELAQESTNLKNSLKSMLALLKEEEATPYLVKQGDSLGKIAQDHKINIKTLKEFNNLSSDIIFPGQKLQIPPIQ